MQISPVVRQGRDKVPSPHKSYHSANWKLSPISSSPRDKHISRQAKGVPDMFLALKKNKPPQTKQQKNPPNQKANSASKNSHSNPI